MTRGGRPLRFLGVTLGGWTVLRAGMLWPTIETPRDLIRLFVPPAAAAVSPRMARPAASIDRMVYSAAVPVRVAAIAPMIAPPPHRAADPARAAPASASVPGFGRDVSIKETGAIPPPVSPTPADPVRRLTGSMWGIARQGVAVGLPGGQLGGSQAGVRVAYALGAARRTALTARLSAPLEGRGREAAVGVEFRPARLPLRIVAEQRVPLDGGRGGRAFYAVGGITPAPVAAGFRLEAYAQGGVVVRGRARGFADGAARLTRPVSGAFDLGAGAWAGVQPGVARVDLGPTIGLSLPVARRRIRVSLDWRQRVAGQARPGSGPALSIGSDF